MRGRFKKVYQFKITLKGIKPPIWRRIQVPENYTFWDLHVAIQDSMGWEDYHLHEFEILDPSKGLKVNIGIPPGELGVSFEKETIDKAADGTVIKRTLMINIREETVEKCLELYSALQKKLEELREPKGNNQSNQKMKPPLCPIHQVPMVLKQNRNNGHLFWGCPKWLPDGTGCNQTMPYLKEENTETVVEVG